MGNTFKNHELYELSFDFSSLKKGFHVSALINPARLELLDDADTPEKFQKAISYTIEEIVEPAFTKKLSDMMQAQDRLTLNYTNAICSMVSMILHLETGLQEYFSEGNFHFKAHSLQKITLQ